MICPCLPKYYKPGQYYSYRDFWDFLDFFVFFDFYMGFWAREGLEMVRGWIPLHLDQVSAQMDHSGSILIVNFSKTHLRPK